MKILAGVDSLVVEISPSLTGVGSTEDVPLDTYCALLASVARLFSNECYWKLEMKYTKLTD